MNRTKAILSAMLLITVATLAVSALCCAVGLVADTPLTRTEYDKTTHAVIRLFWTAVTLQVGCAMLLFSMVASGRALSAKIAIFCGLAFTCVASSFLGGILVSIAVPGPFLQVALTFFK